MTTEPIDFEIEGLAIEKEQDDLNMRAVVYASDKVPSFVSNPDQREAIRDLIAAGYVAGHAERDAFAMAELIGQEHRLGGRIEALVFQIEKLRNEK